MVFDNLTAEREMPIDATIRADLLSTYLVGASLPRIASTERSALMRLVIAPAAEAAHQH